MQAMILSNDKTIQKVKIRSAMFCDIVGIDTLQSTLRRRVSNGRFHGMIDFGELLREDQMGTIQSAVSIQLGRRR